MSSGGDEGEQRVRVDPPTSDQGGGVCSVSLRLEFKNKVNLFVKFRVSLNLEFR